MTPALALAFAQAVLAALPSLIGLGVDIQALVIRANTVLASKSDPTQADWDAINAEINAGIDALKARLTITPPPALVDPIS